MGARSFFESVREASFDAERCRCQLDYLETNALRISSPSFEARVSGTHDPDRMACRVAALVDQEAALHARIEEDYRLIDLACTVLYGADGMSDGLARLVPTWWCDAVYYHFCQRRTWAQVGALLGYSERHVRNQASAALDVADATGLMDTIGGMGMAEG